MCAACTAPRGYIIAARAALVAVSRCVYTMRIGPGRIRAIDERKASGYAIGQIAPRTSVRSLARYAATVPAAASVATTAPVAGAAFVASGRRAFLIGVPSATAGLALRPQAQTIAVIALAFAQDSSIAPCTGVIVAAYARAGSPGRGLHAGLRSVTEAHLGSCTQRSNDFLLDRRIPHARLGKHPLIAKCARFLPA